MLANKPISYSLLSLGGAQSSSSPSSRKRHAYSTFEGQMQQLIMNSRSLFELIANGDLNPVNQPISVINKTVSFSRPDIHHKYPLTFRSASSTWLALSKIDTHHLLMIQFHFKTSLANGLVMYNRGHNDDFIAIELTDGQIVFSFGLNRVRIWIFKSIII